MPTIILYLLKFSISIALVYLFYQLVLRRLTFYAWNRLYLFGYCLLCFVIPFINISPLAQQHHFDNTELIKYIPVIENYTAALPAHTIVQNVVAENHSINGWQIFYAILIAGSVIMLIRLIAQLISLQKIKKNAIIIHNDETVIYNVNKKITPFSFGNAIYVNQDLHSEKELQEIILHEYVHVKQNHTADIILSELICVINWYNPFAWLMRHAIRQNLEFIADNKVLQHGTDKRSYQYHLIKVVGSPQYRIANNFNFSSLKKRIAMMNKIKSAKLHLLRFLFVLPLLAVLLLAFRDKYKEIFEKQTFINDVGIIIDIVSKEPIAGVSVADTVSGINTVTDKRGFFSLKIPVKKDTGRIYLTFNKTGYANDFSENTIPILSMRSHGRIDVIGLISATAKKQISTSAIISFFGYSIEKFPDEPTYADALQQLKKVKHSSEDWDLFSKLQNDHPEVTMFYTSEYKNKNIVIYKDGRIEKYGFAGGPTIDDMEKKFGTLPDVMIKNESPIPTTYLAKWEAIATEAEKKFHTDNPDVNTIIFPGDSRAIPVPKNGKPRIYDLDNNVPEERSLFEKLYGSLDGIVPPATNFANGAHNDARYKDWRVSGIEFFGFTKIDLDKDISLTHFIGDGVLKISNNAKALIIYNNKEYDPESFKQKFSNTKFKDVFIYENEGAFNKFGEKGKNGVIIINNNSSASTLMAPVISVSKKDTVPSNKDGATIQLSKDTKQITFDVKKHMDSVLFILDDKEIDSSYLSKLDVMQIESINILKDSSATNQYGSRASHGVIIITTKKALEKNKPAMNKKDNDVSFASAKSEYQIKINLLWLLEEYINHPKFEYKLIPENLGIDNASLTRSIEDYDDLQRQREINLRTTNENDNRIKEINDQLRKIRREITHRSRDIRLSLKLKINKS